MAMDDILNELARRIEWRKQIILYGPPGTGKTFTAKRLAYKLITKKTLLRIWMNLKKR